MQQQRSGGLRIAQALRRGVARQDDRRDVGVPVPAQGFQNIAAGLLVAQPKVSDDQVGRAGVVPAEAARDK